MWIRERYILAVQGGGGGKRGDRGLHWWAPLEVDDKLDDPLPRLHQEAINGSSSHANEAGGSKGGDSAGKGGRSTGEGGSMRRDAENVVPNFDQWGKLRAPLQLRHQHMGGFPTDAVFTLEDDEPLSTVKVTAVAAVARAGVGSRTSTTSTAGMISTEVGRVGKGTALRQPQVAVRDEVMRTQRAIEMGQWKPGDGGRLGRGGLRSGSASGVGDVVDDGGGCKIEEQEDASLLPRSLQEHSPHTIAVRNGREVAGKGKPRT